MTKYQRAPEAMFALIDADVVALQVERGTCFGMERVTADIWKLLEHPISIDEMCGQLVDRYSVGIAQCRAEVEQLIRQMADEGLVKAAA